MQIVVIDEWSSSYLGRGDIEDNPAITGFANQSLKPYEGARYVGIRGSFCHIRGVTYNMFCSNKLFNSITSYHCMIQESDRRS
jgi:hypothetical protein